MSEYVVFCDGSCRANTAGGWAAVIMEKRTHRKHVLSGSKKNCTNNEMEYMAVLEAVKWLPLNSKAVIQTDSQLVVKQLNGEYQTRHPKLKKLKDEIDNIVQQKNLQVEYKWVGRGYNEEANRITQAESAKLLAKK